MNTTAQTEQDRLLTQLHLQRFADDRLWQHRKQAAEHPDTPIEALIKLSRDRHPAVRQSTTLNRTYTAFREQLAVEAQIDPSLPSAWRERLIEVVIQERFPNL